MGAGVEEVEEAVKDAGLAEGKGGVYTELQEVTSVELAVTKFFFLLYEGMTLVMKGADLRP